MEHFGSLNKAPDILKGCSNFSSVGYLTMLSVSIPYNFDYKKIYEREAVNRTNNGRRKRSKVKEIKFFLCLTK
jgi:hypothetical protein